MRQERKKQEQQARNFRSHARARGAPSLASVPILPQLLIKPHLATRVTKKLVSTITFLTLKGQPQKAFECQHDNSITIDNSSRRVFENAFSNLPQLRRSLCEHTFVVSQEEAITPQDQIRKTQSDGKG